MLEDSTTQVFSVSDIFSVACLSTDNVFIGVLTKPGEIFLKQMLQSAASSVKPCCWDENNTFSFFSPPEAG